MKTSAHYGLLLRLGLLYLLIIGCGVFAHFAVRMPLLEMEPGTALIEHIHGQRLLVRLSQVADLLMVLADILVGWLFYKLLLPVNSQLSLLAAVFRWVQSAILAWGLLRLSDLQTWAATNPADLDAGQAMEASLHIQELIRDHAGLYSISGIFFGLSCVVLGFLFIRAEFMPFWLGVLLALAGLAYLIDGGANLFMPAHTATTEVLVTIAALVAEILLCLWLLVAGVRGIRMYRRSEA